MPTQGERMNIVVSNVKGGVGKTTTSVYLAASAAERGWNPVILVDADRQASSAEWLEERPVEGVDLVEAPSERTVSKALAGGKGLAVVDTPPGDERIVRAAMDRADAVVVPTRAGGVEYSRVLATLEMISPRTPHGLVICAARLGTNDLTEAIAWWTDSKVPIWGIIPERVGIASGPEARSRIAKVSTPTGPCSRRPYANAEAAVPAEVTGTTGRGRPADVNPPRSPPLPVELAGPGGHVHRMLLQGDQRHDFESPLVGRGQHDIGGGPVVVGAKPVDGGHAPAVTGYQARKAVLGHGCHQVVPDGPLMFQELGGDHRADGVTAHVFGATRTATVAVEAGQRIGAARFEHPPEHIAISHGQL